MTGKIKKQFEILRDYIEYMQKKNCYVGDVGIICDSDKTEAKSSNEINIELKIKLIKEKCRLLRHGNYFRDMDTHIKYYDTNIALGSCRVINSTPISNSKTKSKNRKR